MATLIDVFFFDEKGQFINGEYIVGILAGLFLQREVGATIVHDSRLLWNCQEVISEAEGVSVISKTGHSFFKKAMRVNNAIYGGEVSGHHYFRDFAYCDSGMIPWLLLMELLSIRGKKLSELVGNRKKMFPSTSEINLRVNNQSQALDYVLNFYKNKAVSID